MSVVPQPDRRPADLAPAAALVLALVVTLVPRTTASELLSAEPARTAPLHTEVAP